MSQKFGIVRFLDELDFPAKLINKVQNVNTISRSVPCL